VKYTRRRLDLLHKRHASISLPKGNEDDTLLGQITRKHESPPSTQPEVSIVSKSASVGGELLNGDDSLGSCDISGIVTCSCKEADIDSAKEDERKEVR
jgi:hypothetical protein